MTRRTIRTAACSTFALASALAAMPAAAQVAPGSFQGTPTTAFGAVTVTEGPGTTDVQVDSTSAIVSGSTRHWPSRSSVRACSTSAAMSACSSP